MPAKDDRPFLNRVPFLGYIFNRREVLKASSDTTPVGARDLAEIIAGSGKANIRNLAIKHLSSRTDQDSINAVCNFWVGTRSPELLSVIRENSWHPDKPGAARVELALVENQPERLRQADPEEVGILIETLEDEDNETSSAARTALENLEVQAGIDALCQEWKQSQNQAIQDIIISAGHVASRPDNLHFLTATLTTSHSVIAEYGGKAVDKLNKSRSAKNDQIATGARTLLLGLTSTETKDRLCELVVESESTDLEDIALEAGFAPSGEQERALFFFLTAQWEKYDEFDPDHSLLQEACEDPAQGLYEGRRLRSALPGVACEAS